MKPFPFVLGTDIIRITRLDPLKDHSRFVRLAHRILHDNEITSAKYRKFPSFGDSTHQDNLYNWLNSTTRTTVPSEISSSQQHIIKQQAHTAARWLAGRWAAKEAAKKAWGAGLLGWKDVRVEIAHGGQSTACGSSPVRIICQPYSEPDDQFGEIQEEVHLHQEGILSISHDGEYCVATVIAEPLEEQLLATFENRARIVRDRMERRSREIG